MLINLWHSILNMPKMDKEWHIADIKDETLEYEEAVTFLEKWSELSDIVYTCTRAKWSGHDLKFPFPFRIYIWGALYMIPKYSFRWIFYRYIVWEMGSKVKITEVRNPKKIEKLEGIAKKYNLDPEIFVSYAKKTLAWWPLLY